MFAESGVYDRVSGKNGYYDDWYVNSACVDGTCPLIVEEVTYGVVLSDCASYCGNEKEGTCKSCYFDGSDICGKCCRYAPNVRERTFGKSGLVLPPTSVAVAKHQQT